MNSNMQMKYIDVFLEHFSFFLNSFNVVYFWLELLEENISRAPRLYCGAHQAFANLHQVYQRLSWLWVTGASPTKHVSVAHTSPAQEYIILISMFWRDGRGYGGFM